MEQFNLDKYLENPTRKVCTRQGKSIRIICTDRRHTDSWPIVALEDYGDGEFVVYANIDGRTDMCAENIHDLFFADEEDKPQSIKIPFGAFDSEFVKDEYHIPDGCEARIEGRKVIIEKIQKEEELTEFEKMLRYVLECYAGLEFASRTEIETLKLNAKSLLDLARKEILEEFRCREELFYKNGFERGRETILKDLPKWKKVPSHEKQVMYGMSEISDIYYEGYFIHLDDIYKALPKEE